MSSALTPVVLTEPIAHDENLSLLELLVLTRLVRSGATDKRFVNLVGVEGTTLVLLDQRA